MDITVAEAIEARLSAVEMYTNSNTSCGSLELYVDDVSGCPRLTYAMHVPNIPWTVHKLCILMYVHT